MIAKKPHNQGPAKPASPLMRAVMMDVALCLMGVALYIQTKLIALPIVFAIAGTVLVVGAVLQMRKQREAAQPQRRTANRSGPTPGDSNVIPFKRKTTGKASRSDADQKSNWPSA